MHGINRLISSISRLIHGLHRLRNRISRLINGSGPGAASRGAMGGWGGGGGPRARAGPQPLISRIIPVINRVMLVIIAINYQGHVIREQKMLS